jgi:hypothetical protein
VPEGDVVVGGFADGVEMGTPEVEGVVSCQQKMLRRLWL